jgi:hypothetical protein
MGFLGDIVLKLLCGILLTGLAVMFVGATLALFEFLTGVNLNE